MTSPEAHNTDNNDESQTETLAERSARLEAELAAQADAERSGDPLAPEPLPEEDPLDYAPSPALEALQAELTQAKEQTLRALADAENTRRRAQKDREDAGKFGISNFARDLLEVVDNLRRALDAIPQEGINEQVKNVLEGIEATERTFLKVLEKNGVQKLDPQGEKFDPNFHEVMFETPGTGQPAGSIIQVLETGYTIHDRILRPARVGVAKDDGNHPPTGQGDNIDTKI